jgi:hypothetical protein
MGEGFTPKGTSGFSNAENRLEVETVLVTPLV